MGDRSAKTFEQLCGEKSKKLEMLFLDHSWI
jgi:hypothetical protein